MFTVAKTVQVDFLSVIRDEIYQLDAYCQFGISMKDFIDTISQCISVCKSLEIVQETYGISTVSGKIIS